MTRIRRWRGRKRLDSRGVSVILGSMACTDSRPCASRGAAGRPPTIETIPERAQADASLRCRRPAPFHDRTRQVLRTRRHRSALGPAVGSQRRLRADAGPGEALLQHPAAAAQRDRHAAHGPCVQPDDHGRADALPPHEGLQHRCGCRAPTMPASPRRSSSSASCRTRGSQPPRPGPRRTSWKRSGSGRRRSGSTITSRCAAWATASLGARVLHHGRQAVARSSPRPSCGCTSKGLIYRGKRLVNWDPVLKIGRLRPGGRERGGRRLRCGSSAIRWWTADGSAGGGHHAAGDHARRRGGDGAPRGRALCRT